MTCTCGSLTNGCILQHYFLVLLIVPIEDFSYYYYHQLFTLWSRRHNCALIINWSRRDGLDGLDGLVQVWHLYKVKRLSNWCNTTFLVITLANVNLTLPPYDKVLLVDHPNCQFWPSIGIKRFHSLLCSKWLDLIADLYDFGWKQRQVSCHLVPHHKGSPRFQI